MPYTATFYALHPIQGEIVVTIHKLEQDMLAAYTSMPGIALAAARTVKGDPKADGFRVVTPDGKTLLDFVERPGAG